MENKLSWHTGRPPIEGYYWVLNGGGETIIWLLTQYDLNRFAENGKKWSGPILPPESEE